MKLRKINHPLFWKCCGLGGAIFLKGLLGTVDFKAIYQDATLDPANPDSLDKRIAFFWHENILAPIYLRGTCQITMLQSRNRDANLVSEVGRLFGLKVVKGSTNRGGTEALRALMRIAGEPDCRGLVVVPDGPRGPRRSFTAGGVFLASKLQIPVLLLGIGYDRPWRMNSWDQFAIPRPFSRGRAVFSRRIDVPPKLSRDELEDYRLAMERMLTQVTDEAEEWATSGRSMIGETSIQPGPCCSLAYHSQWKNFDD